MNMWPLTSSGQNLFEPSSFLIRHKSALDNNHSCDKWCHVCISYFIILHVLLRTHRSHINTSTPNLADSLSLTNRMSVLLSPPREVVQLFLGVSQTWLGSSSALASSLVYCLPGTAGKISCRKATDLLGMTRHAQWQYSVQKQRECPWTQQRATSIKAAWLRRSCH